MKITLLSAILGSQLLIPVATDAVPIYKVEGSCRDATMVTKSESISASQSYESCMRDENQARQELPPVWQAAPMAIRDRCNGEASGGGVPSYVDLLVCLQIAKDASATPDSVTPLKGASKKKRKKT